MVKTIRCSSCGASLNFTQGQPNVVCEYCKSFVRVSDDRAPQFDTSVILEQIVQLWPRVRDDNFTEEYQEIKILISKHRYMEANRRLNRILEKDKTQARAWFYKSLLPILEQETIFFKGSYVNIVKVSQITNRKLLKSYLKSCGLTFWQQQKFLKYYRSTDFLYEQHIEFLNKAIEHASTEKRAEFFKDTKANRIKLQKKKLGRRNLANWGLILLLFAVIAGGCVIVWNVFKGNLHV